MSNGGPRPLASGLMRQYVGDASDMDDVLLNGLYYSAKEHVASLLGHQNFGDAAHQAVLMLAAHWYENREASISGTIITSVPLGFDDLIRESRNYTFGLSDDGA